MTPTPATPEPTEPPAENDAGWIEWAQDVTGVYVTTREEARAAIEGIVSGSMRLVMEDLPRLRADAWDEGHDKGVADGQRTKPGPSIVNPYSVTPPGKDQR